MTFKKILGLLALACLTIIGLSACTPEKEPTWTYDKNKMLFTGQDASVQVLSATKIESPEGQKAVRVHYKLSNSSKETMNAYTLLMKVVLDVKQEKEEVEGCYIWSFLKMMTEIRLQIRPRLLLRKLKKSLLTMPLLILIMILALIFLITVLRQMRLPSFHYKILKRHLSNTLIKKLNKSYHHMNVWCFFIV